MINKDTALKNPISATRNVTKKKILVYGSLSSLEIAGVEVKLYTMYLESIRGISNSKFPGPSRVGKNVHKILYKPILIKSYKYVFHILLFKEFQVELLSFSSHEGSFIAFNKTLPVLTILNTVDIKIRPKGCFSELTSLFLRFP